MFLVVGLGNPGPEYAHHRHNIGHMVADALAARWRLGPLKSKFGGEVGTGEAPGAGPTGAAHKVALLKPMEYMNVSGQAVQKAAAFYQVPVEAVIVLHDEIDLPYGRLRVKAGGGHGGHNGLRSITQQMGPGFLRVRIGVGHPGTKEQVVGHVLGSFGKAEQRELPEVIDFAAQATESLIARGLTATMNEYNKDLPRTDPA